MRQWNVITGKKELLIHHLYSVTYQLASYQFHVHLYEPLLVHHATSSTGKMTNYLLFINWMSWHLKAWWKLSQIILDNSLFLLSFRKWRWVVFAINVVLRWYSSFSNQDLQSFKVWNFSFGGESKRNLLKSK